MALPQPHPQRNGRGIDWAAELARHRRWLRTVIVARLGTADGAEDVLQEVSVAAIEQRAPLHDPNKSAAWLYQLAVNQVLLYRRRTGRERRRLSRYGERRANGSNGSPDPLDWLLADERQRLIREAVGRLSEEDAEVLMLKYTEDWTCRDLAEHLGVSHSAV
ncbi:MAG: RNA polymerase sigma factor, partial [Planctomycetaceae bacterium]